MKCFIECILLQSGGRSSPSPRLEDDMPTTDDMSIAVDRLAERLDQIAPGSVAGMEIAGVPFFLGEPAKNGWEIPAKLGAPSARVEVFCDDPDALIARALEAGAIGSLGDI